MFPAQITPCTATSSSLASHRNTGVFKQCVEPNHAVRWSAANDLTGFERRDAHTDTRPEAKLSGRHQDRGHLWNKNMSSYIALPFSPFNLPRHISPCFTWTVHLYLSDVPQSSLALNTPLCVQPEMLPCFHLNETETAVGKDEKKKKRFLCNHQWCFSQLISVLNTTCILKDGQHTHNPFFCLLSLQPFMSNEFVHIWCILQGTCAPSPFFPGFPKEWLPFNFLK